MSAETMVEFYGGLGSDAKVIWSTYMRHCPRVGEEVVIKGQVFDVSKVRHSPDDEKVTVYVR